METCKVVLTFESVNEILWYDHSMKSLWQKLHRRSETIMQNNTTVFHFMDKEGEVQM